LTGRSRSRCEPAYSGSQSGAAALSQIDLFERAAPGATGITPIRRPVSLAADLLQNTPHSALTDCTVQLAGTLPRDTVDARAVPFISHSTVLPEVSRQSRSEKRSPLKSPVSTMVQAIGAEPGEPPPVTVVPFMSHMTTWPLLVLRQTMSLIPSAL